MQVNYQHKDEHHEDTQTKLRLVEEHPSAEDLEQQPWFDSVVVEFID